MRSLHDEPDISALEPAPADPPSRRRYTPWLWAAGFFAVYFYFSLARHRRMETGAFDLGIFQQAVESYSRFRAPVSDLRGWEFPLWGDHFHPILASLVPLYWAHPKASTLLLAQAALVAWSVVPICELATRRLGPVRGQVVAAAYGASWGVQAAIGFDFHEVAFAAPLLAYGLVAFVEERWRAGVWWTLPLLLVKEEFGVTVAALGLWLLLRRRHRDGWLLIGAGAVTFLLVTFVIIPYFNPAHVNPYMSSFGGGRGGGTLNRLLHAPLLMVDHELKRETLFRLGIITGFVALRSPLALVALPGLVARFISSNENYWVAAWHYNLALMPIMFVAYLDAYPRLATSPRRWVRDYGRRSVAVVLGAALALAQHYPLQNVVFSPYDSWQISNQTRVVYGMLARIPDGGIVEVDGHVAPHISDRCRATHWPYPADVHPDWVLVNPDAAYSPPDVYRQHLQNLISSGYVLVDRAEGYWLLRRQ